MYGQHSYSSGEHKYVMRREHLDEGRALAIRGRGEHKVSGLVPGNFSLDILPLFDGFGAGVGSDLVPERGGVAIPGRVV